MGHWAEGRLPELKQQLGISGDEHDAELLPYVRQAQSEIEVLAGHRFESRPFALHIDHGGLPFVATLDMQTATMRANSECWPIADPIHPEFANILQIGRAQNLASQAIGKAEALCAGAAVLAAVHRDGWLSLAPRAWFVEQRKARPALEFGRELMDQGRHVQVPVATFGVGGWWVQLSRRIYFITKDTPDEPSLVELLMPPGDGLALVAGEPILIVARMTEHPSDWAFVARVWLGEFQLHPRAWQLTSQAVHANGVPILCLDEQSTPEEVVAQILLAAYWHGYLEANDAAIPPALARAFPQQVARVRRGTGAPDDQEAATLLFERLLRPGFDPTRGAGSIRHYVARHATTLIRAHRTSEVEFQPWHKLGINERHYYKLLARFGHKELDGRYELDDDTLATIGTYLDDRQRHGDAMALLRSRGFGDAAARKWLQRHSIEEIRTARPRQPREPD